MDKITIEKQTVNAMIQMYCSHFHKSKTLCNECINLRDYSFAKLDKCKFGESKPACKKCPVHCYKPEMKDKIKEVMRYSGAKMLFKHPILSVIHLIKK